MNGYSRALSCGIAIALLPVLAGGGLAQQGLPTAAEVSERARQMTRLQEAFELYPEAVLESHFSEEYGCWVVEFRAEGREVGFATLSPDGEQVLEFSLQAGERDDDSEQGEDERPPGLLQVLRPGVEGGMLFWLALVILALVFFDFERPLSWRNVDVLSLLLLAPFLLLVWPRTRFAYTGIFIVTLYYLGRVMLAALAPGAGAASPNLPARPLAFLLALLFLLHLHVIRNRGVDDCGIFGTFGAQHLLNRGQMPYGQEHFGEGATYGPFFYALHVPPLLIWPPGYEGEGGFHKLQEAFPKGVAYERLHFTAAKAVAVVFDALILLGLIVLGRRRKRLELGLGLAVVYAALPYTIDGLNFSSHIVPAALTVWALVFLEHPLLSGLLLGAGAGTLFYPILLVPLWLSYYQGAQRRRFLTGLTAVGLIGLAAVLWGESSWSAFVASTWGNQEGAGHYGDSAFGFWGQHPELAFLKRPVLLLHLLLCASLFLWPRRKTTGTLVALSAAALIGTQLWKTHAGGTYVEWYMPWLIVVLLGGAAVDEESTPWATGMGSSMRIYRSTVYTAVAKLWQVRLPFG